MNTVFSKQVSTRQEIYLQKIDRGAKLLGIADDKLAKAGISKSKAIFELLGDASKHADIVRLVEEAEWTPLSAIRAEVKKLKGQETGGEDVIEWIKLPVFKSRKEFVMDTLMFVRTLSNDDLLCETKEANNIANAVALERICADIRSDPNYQVEAEEVSPIDDGYYEGL